jgi:hypothetical protein
MIKDQFQLWIFRKKASKLYENDLAWFKGSIVLKLYSIELSKIISLLIHGFFLLSYESYSIVKSMFVREPGEVRPYSLNFYYPPASF